MDCESQSLLPGGFKHIIEVGRYSDYGKGYLTITDANGVGSKKNGIDQMNYYTYEYVDKFRDNYLQNGQLILEVDNIPAEGWTKEQFYKRIDGRNNDIKLKIRTKNNNGIYDFLTIIRPLYELPNDVRVFGNVLATVSGTTKVQRRSGPDGLKNVSYEERHDEDFDFFYCNTYDYLINSDDPLLDKEIFKYLESWWTRNEKTPDILLTIARDANESVSTTYVPPSSRTINVGSKTEVRYNYLTRKNEYITKPKSRTIYEGGYTQETKTADIYLEIAALDAKKVNDPNISYPPIVWKATVKRHVVNPTFNYTDELKAYASWMTPPLADRNVWVEKTVFAPVGVLYWDNNPSVVSEVVPGSRAERIGIMVGDKIIKVDIQNKYLTYGRKYVKKNLKKKGWEVVNQYLEETYNIVILRNKKRVELTLHPVSILINRQYLIEAQ